MINVVHVNGYITKILEMDADQVEYNLDEGEECVEITEYISPEEHWVSEGLVLAKTPFTTLKYKAVIKVGQRIHISGVPVNTRVIWPDGVFTTETDRNIEADITLPGEYLFRLHHVEHLAKEITINVTA